MSADASAGFLGAKPSLSTSRSKLRGESAPPMKKYFVGRLDEFIKFQSSSQTDPFATSMTSKLLVLDTGEHSPENTGSAMYYLRISCKRFKRNACQPIHPASATLE